MVKLRRSFLHCSAIPIAALCFAVALGAQTPAAPNPHPAPAAQAPQWKTYSYPADGFSASYPSQPDVQKRDVPTDAGSFELHSYLVQVSPGALYIGVCDYGAAAAGKDAATLLDGAKNGALTNSTSHLISESRITLGNYPGVAFEAENEEAHFSARLYVVGTMLYQTMVVSLPGKPYPETARFLDSFQLIARVAK